MSEETLSILTGTAGLSLACIAAFALTLARSGIATENARDVRLVSAITLIIQLAHTIEEYHYQFYERFPQLLGLQVWPREFFVIFNLTWLIIWASAIIFIESSPKASAFPLWFLGIASVANGVTHPILSIAVAEYFPGLWTSVILGVTGYFLVTRLVHSTSTR